MMLDVVESIAKMVTPLLVLLLTAAGRKYRQSIERTKPSSSLERPHSRLGLSRYRQSLEFLGKPRTALQQANSLACVTKSNALVTTS